MAACGQNVEVTEPNYASTVQIANETKEDIQVQVLFHDEKEAPEKAVIKAGDTWTSTIRFYDNGLRDVNPVSSATVEGGAYKATMNVEEVVKGVQETFDIKVTMVDEALVMTAA